jgi:ABC-type uncharacterized transport system substrate-binding protein
MLRLSCAFVPETAMRRRKFISLIGSVAANVASAKDYTPLLSAFLKGLSEAGFVDGRNASIEYRWAEGRVDQLPAMVADLVHRRVAVIAATGTPAALAARAATTTIPTVFETAADPVKLGLVASLSRPGGNVTGVTMPAIHYNPEFAAAGGLLSYGEGSADAYRLAGNYTGRVLKGDKPADLPVQQATKVELHINLKTAKVLGVTFPESILQRADQVIE